MSFWVVSGPLVTITIQVESLTVHHSRGAVMQRGHSLFSQFSSALIQHVWWFVSLYVNKNISTNRMFSTQTLKTKMMWENHITVFKLISVLCCNAAVHQGALQLLAHQPGPTHVSEACKDFTGDTMVWRRVSRGSAKQWQKYCFKTHPHFLYQPCGL